MSLHDRIEQDVLASIKRKDAATTSTLRMLKAALKNKEIELLHPLTQEETLAVVKSQMKMLKDSLEEFERAKRADLALGARVEITCLEQYLPSQMDDATLAETVRTALREAGMTSKAQMGQAMGVAMKATAGGADGGRVKRMVEGLLIGLLLAVISLSAGAVHAASTQAAGAEATAYLLPILRISRSFILLLGLVAVNLILIGGFTYMVASGRDHGHESGMEKVATGILATVAIAALYLIMTVAIQRVSV